MADKKKTNLPSMTSMEIRPHHFPSTLTLDENDFPDIADWSVGKEYVVEVVVKQVSANQDELIPEGDTDADKIHAKFEVTKVLEGKPYDEKKESKEEEKELPVAKAFKNKFLKKE